MEVVVNRLIELSSGKDDELRDISTLGIVHQYPLPHHIAHVNDSTQEHLCRNTERSQHRLFCMRSIGPSTSGAVAECMYHGSLTAHVSHMF